MAIERALATLDEPLITAFVQQGLDLCISLPWTAACSWSLPSAMALTATDVAMVLSSAVPIDRKSTRLNSSH